MTDLHQLLREATEHVGPPDLTGRALAAAHRRRVRRTAAGALAAVVLLGGGVAWAVQGPLPKAGVVDTPGPSPTPDGVKKDSSELPSAPEIDLSVVQPRWDPAGVGGLPWSDLGLPESLEPPIEAPALTSIRAARAVVGREDRFFVLDDEGEERWFSMERPDEPMGQANDDVALSRDGTIVSFAGIDGLWSMDVRSGRWRRADYPEGFQSGSDYVVTLEAQVGEMAWITDASGRWEIDVQTGKADQIQVPKYVYDVAFAPHGLIVGVGSGQRAPHYVRTLVLLAPGAQEPLVTEANALWSLTGLAADADSLAAMRGVGVTGPDLDESFRNGLIALDIDDWSTRAYLPVRDPHYSYADAGLMQSLAWLDPDSVLVSVVSPDGGYDTGELTLFTWHVETGELRRVTSLPAALRHDVALDLLRY